MDSKINDVINRRFEIATPWVACLRRVDTEIKMAIHRRDQERLDMALSAFTLMTVVAPWREGTREDMESYIATLFAEVSLPLLHCAWLIVTIVELVYNEPLKRSEAMSILSKDGMMLMARTWDLGTEATKCLGIIIDRRDGSLQDTNSSTRALIHAKNRPQQLFVTLLVLVASTTIGLYLLPNQDPRFPELRTGRILAALTIIGLSGVAWRLSRHSNPSVTRLLIIGAASIATYVHWSILAH